MAKSTNKEKKNKNSTKGQASPPPRNPIYLGVVGLLAAAWITWRLEPSQGLGTALAIGVAVGLAWLVFVVLMNRTQRQGNDD